VEVEAFRKRMEEVTKGKTMVKDELKEARALARLQEEQLALVKEELKAAKRGKGD